MKPQTLAARHHGHREPSALTHAVNAVGQLDVVVVVLKMVSACGDDCFSFDLSAERCYNIRKLSTFAIPIGRVGWRRRVAFFDNGSHLSFISENLANELSLQGGQTEFDLRTLAGLSGYKGNIFDNLELSDFYGTEYAPLHH